MATWRTKPGADQRIRGGHPWVRQQDIQVFPRNHVPGEMVELQDHQGQFLARGYGNAESQIAFRAVTFDSSVFNPLSREYLLKKTIECWKFRDQIGLRQSARIVFSECDDLPGLILDRYLLHGEKKRQVFAVQISTAGMSRALPDVEKFLEELVTQAQEASLCEMGWADTAVVIRNDLSIRELEGLREEPPRFVKSFRDVDFSKVQIILPRADGGNSDTKHLLMSCDLYQGQKTGFFLDQTANIAQLCQFLKSNLSLQRQRVVRVLDLCCYVGHWSAQITAALRQQGIEVETTLVDVSKKALEFARVNAEAQGAKVTCLPHDVLKPFPKELVLHSFDIVIADPPAFVKAKKDIPTGSHAYLKLNTKALQYAKPWSFFVSCSCSGLITEEDFRGIIGKAIRRSGASTRMIAKGGPAPDHPGRLSFPDGHYLKMFIHQVGELGPTRTSEPAAPEVED